MIEQFKEPYRWLSNFWKFNTPLEYQNLLFPTVEHFYVAMKTTSWDLRHQASLTDRPKSFGRGLELREDWEQIKLDVMLYATRYKYSELNPNLRRKLLNTGEEYIQEGNWWGDKFWGVCLKTGEGENNLGKIIMQVREEIRDAI
jgi:hypothetical protein